MALEKQLMAWHKANPVSQRLATIPGIGPIIATAIAAMVAEPSGFRSGREFAAWLGLVPRQNSTGGKNRLGGISKRGNQYLRRLLINGASANLLRSKATNADPWVIGLRRRRPSLVVAVALANPAARYVCTVCGYIYDPEKGDPEGNVKPGTRFEELPADWVCPICGAEKDKFEKEA